MGEAFAGIPHHGEDGPDWMTISNSLPRSSLKFSRSPARIRWPVLEDRQKLGEAFDHAEDQRLEKQDDVHE